MLITEGLAMLNISAPVLGRPDMVHPVLMWDQQSVTLVDTGFPKQFDQLKIAVERYIPSIINHIIITHQDIDHIGNLQDITSSSTTKIEVLAHNLEKPYIQGDRRLIRFTDEAIAGIDLLPDHVPESFKKGLKTLMLHPPHAPVDRTIRGGDHLPLYGGITVIDSPGHTPGHISLYHEASRTLIAGDALTVSGGLLDGPNLETTLDWNMAITSLKRLAALDIQRVLCYHGGLFEGNANKRISELATELGS